MAEIKIEKKKPVWPWVILALLIIGCVLAWLLMDRGKETQNVITPITEETEQSDSISANKNSPVATYVDFVQSDKMQMGLDHKYTHKAFTLLAEAVIYTAKNQDYELEKDLSELKEKGDQIKKDPMSLKHANIIKNGFESVIKVFESMQQEVSVSGLGRLKDYSDNLNPDVPTLEQKTAVKGFFDESAQILQDINK